MDEPRFSVCIIAKNEAGSLPNLLKSLTEFRDRGGDIVLVDTGSTDTTVEIAKDFGCNVYFGGDRFSFAVDRKTAKAINSDVVVRPEGPAIKAGDVLFHYGYARNFADGLAKNDMICNPDPDEIFTRLDIDTINDFINQGFERFEVDFTDQHGPDGQPTNRFFSDARWHDRRVFDWVGTMHETLTASVDIPTSRLARLPTEVCYMEHWQKPNNNRSKYLANLAYACHVDPTNERQAHCFARQLLYEGRYNSAIKAFMRHILMKEV